MASTRQPLFTFQLQPSPHLVTSNFTYYQPRMKHHSSQCQDGLWQFLVSQPILTLEKVLSPQGSTPVPKFQLFSIFMHFYTLLIKWGKKKKKKKWRSCQFSYTDYKNQTGAETLLRLFWAQVLGPSPGLRHLLTETGNKPLLIQGCVKTHSAQHLWYS